MAEQEQPGQGSPDQKASKFEIGGKAEASFSIGPASSPTSTAAAHDAVIDAKATPEIDPLARADDVGAQGALQRLREGRRVVNEFRADDQTAPDAPMDAKEEARQATAIYNITIENYVHSNTGIVAGQIAGDIHKEGADRENRARTEPANLWSFGRFVLTQEKVSDLSYVLAVAALSGAPVAAVNQAADDLAARLIALTVVPDSKEAKPPGIIQIATPRRSILADLGCEISVGDVVDADEIPAARVRFSDAGAEQLLRSAWLNLRLSVPWMAWFTDWLSALGRSRDLELRLAAGRTVGLLASWDLAAAEPILFNSWISGRAVDALGAGLMALVKANDNAKRYVEKRLLEWTEGQGGRNRIVAASLLAAGAFGHAQPDIAFRLLASLVRQRRYLTLDLAAMGYAVWFATAANDPAVGNRVIVEVSKLRSAHGDKIIRKLTGMYFLVLTAALDSDGDDDDSSEQLFLEVVGAAPEALQLAATLFNELLAPNVHANAALERFKSICLYAFRGPPAAQRAFTALVESMHVQGDGDQRERLHYWLGYWLGEVHEHSAAAGAALGSLIERVNNGAVTA